MLSYLGMDKKTKIGIYYRETNPQVEAEEYLLSQFDKYGFVFDNDNPDIVIHIGGDGTFIRAVHHYIDRINEIKFVGIKAGTLGFFYDFDKSDLNNILDIIKNDEYKLYSYKLIEGNVVFENNNKKFYAINELRIESPFRTLICDVKINNELLEKFRGNGLNVSSSLGSTAYNKSLGGAVVDQELSTLQLSAIAPISNNVYRSLGSSLVLKDGSLITFEGDFKSVDLGFDHQYVSVENAKRIEIRNSDKTLHIIRNNNHSYIDMLRRSFIK